MNTASCPICGELLKDADPRRLPTFPFCSERCKVIDLGRWLGEGYRLPAEEDSTADDLDAEQDVS